MGIPTDYGEKELAPVRRRIVELFPKSRSNLRMASVAIDRNTAYLHQFIHRETHKVFSEHDRETLARHLGCKLEELKYDWVPPQRLCPKTLRRKPKVKRAPPRGYVAIPEIDVRAEAGFGTWNEESNRLNGFGFSPIL